MGWRVEHGDCVALMAGMPDASVDAVVCDPPYGLEFMGKGWDAPWKRGERGDDAGFVPTGYSDGAERLARPTFTGNPNTSCLNCGGSRRGKQTENGPRRCGCDAPSFPNIGATQGRAFQAWCALWAVEALRVLKPGGHLLAFGGTRTYHRLTCGLEDAGFEVRDTLAWLYGSGFPKSLDVSKAIDKSAGAERAVGDLKVRPDGSQRPNSEAWTTGMGYHGNAAAASVGTIAATLEAERWEGWGTALKPAHEPVVLARKPLAGTVAGNVLAHGTGALNVDGCRIDFRDEDDRWKPEHHRQSAAGDGYHGINQGVEAAPGAGRWPANVALDPEAAAMLDEQTGVTVGGNSVGPRPTSYSHETVYEGGIAKTRTPFDYGDTGGASRFFYVAKADSNERSHGLHGERNPHPTVKPVALMRWLCRLITPPSGTVLDPFTGSGTTGIAALREGFSFIGFEQDADYVRVARARIIGDAPLINGVSEEAA